MSGTRVELYTRLALPPIAVRDAMMHVMRSIAEHDPRYNTITLAIELHGPGHPQLRVPIEATVVNRPGRCRWGIHIEAAQSEQLFPMFDGTLSVTPDGGNESELSLQGEYAAPGGIIGKGLDATLLHGYAEDSLRGFLSWIADHVKAEVERSERERADEARRFHG